MQLFPLANIQTMIEYGIKKKDPSVITVAMLHENLAVDDWAQKIISWLQPLSKKSDKHEDYARQIRINILAGIKNMSPTQNKKLRQYLTDNPTFSQQLQSAIPIPVQDYKWKEWWHWNEVLAKAGLVDFKNPTLEIQKQLNVLSQHITKQNNMGRSGFSLGPSNDIITVWLAHQNPVLAQALWKHILQTTYSTTTLDADYWTKLQAQDWSWLKNVSIAETTVELKLYEQSSYSHNSHKHHLALMTALLPKMNYQDRIHIAPISTWIFGKTSVKTLSPQTFKGVWKFFDKSYERSVPRQYKGDTYMLYSLTGCDATVLHDIFNSLDIKDSNTYLYTTRQWLVDNMPELKKEKHDTPDNQIDASLF